MEENVFCVCGCGEETPLAKRTDSSWGHIKGRHLRCINGHQWKISIKDKGFKKGHKQYNSGKTWFGYGQPVRRGKNSNFWKGGITNLGSSIRYCSTGRAWVKFILKRDNWTCQICGNRGGKMVVDHITPLAKILKINNIKNLNDAFECEEVWSTLNGRTLCEECHKKTDTFGIKTYRSLYA